tara:strand:- start:296 stop:451 length:156 start_codon:yes stop_codon:yes gene_type:complete
MTNKKNSSKQKSSNVNTIGDFLSEELKKQINNAVKKKDPIKKDNQKAVGNK